MTETATDTYSPSGNAFEKQIKTMKIPDRKETKAIEDHEKQLLTPSEVKEILKHFSNKEKYLTNLLMKDNF